jgi:hypothetical protein
MKIRAFAHNPSGDPIPGASQFIPNQILPGAEKFVYLAWGTPDAGYEGSGLQWWAGPDEDAGWIIARINVDAEGNPQQPTEIPGVLAPLGFWCTDGLTDEAFLSVANNLAMPLEVTFDNVSNAYNWLKLNYYWTNYPNPLNEGLLAYYKFDENLFDATGDYDATAPNLIYTEGILGDAALFTATTDSDIETGSLPPIAQGTAALWIYPKYGNGQYVLGGDPFEIQIFDNSFYFRPAESGSFVNIPIPAENEWYFLVATFDGNNISISLNAGTPVTEVNTGTSFGATQEIGVINNGVINDYRLAAGSKMDEFGIWDRVLTYAEIVELYNNGSGITHPFE